MNRGDFRQLANYVDPPHQHLALKYAVAMSGANAAQDYVHLEKQCYLSARGHLEKAETQADGASFCNIETVQALILVARFEFTKANAARALLTTSRLMRLLSLLGYDHVDRTVTGSDKERFASLAPSVNSAAGLQEVRRTFWIAFSMHCHAIANAGGPGAVETDEVCLEHVMLSPLSTCSSWY